jgi:hypothetical protein
MAIVSSLSRRLSRRMPVRRVQSTFGIRLGTKPKTCSERATTARLNLSAAILPWSFCTADPTPCFHASIRRMVLALPRQAQTSEGNCAVNGPKYQQSASNAE